MAYMVPYLLDGIYLIGLAIVSPYLAWQAMRKGKYREGFCHKVLGRPPRRRGEDRGKRCLWLHGVSVGEINLLATLVRRIEAERPDWQCVVSTTTLTGMALARKRFPHLNVFYCPLDFSWAVRNAMRRIAPDVLVLAELELWPNLIRAAKEIGAKVAVVNGRLSRGSFQGYRKVRPFVASVLRQIDLVATQSETYAGRFHALGASGQTIHVTGSMKFDGAEIDRDNPRTARLRRLADIAPDDIVFLAGSTQAPEESLAIDTFRHLSRRYPALRLILVPRHPHRFDEVAAQLDASGLAWERRSALEALKHSAAAEVKESSTELTNAPTEEVGVSEDALAEGRPRILLVDTVGELDAWWGVTQIAFVGGSMGRRGGQNMIEPAAFGAAVSFGPNTRNFHDVVTLMLGNEAAVVVDGGESLTRFVQRCLEEPEYRTQLAAAAKRLVGEQLGATARTIELLVPLVEGTTPRVKRRRSAA